MDIPAKEEDAALLTFSAGEYGSTTNSTEAENSSDGDDEDVIDTSFHLASSPRLQKANVWTSMRFTQSFIEYGDDYEKVPTLFKENIAIMLDPNLDPHEKGRLYYAENSFYNINEDPHYAVSVNLDIYQRMIREVVDAKTVPCGLYFCCHDTSDLAHGDYVDIRLAWALLSVVFVLMIVTSIA